MYKVGILFIQLHVLGTPAEEEGGGKIVMINADTFKDIDFAMMSHPTPFSLALVDENIICRQE